MTTPGIRNNNPGNIRISSIAWLGKDHPSKDPHYESFDTPEDGIRALCLNLYDFQKLHKLSTIYDIISRWAPAEENDTESYIRDVSQTTGFGSYVQLNLADPSILGALAAAIIKHENGVQPYDQLIIAAAVERALTS